MQNPKQGLGDISPGPGALPAAASIWLFGASSRTGQLRDPMCGDARPEGLGARRGRWPKTQLFVLSWGLREPRGLPELLPPLQRAFQQGVKPGDPLS